MLTEPQNADYIINKSAKIWFRQRLPRSVMYIILM
ncbi:MAG: hypothetical protein PARBA_00495 [Parabacteroides sp.]